MTPSDVPALIEELTGFVEVLNSVGLPGFLLLIFSAPAMVVCLILFLNHQNNVRTEKILAAYREDTQAILSELSGNSIKYSELIEKTLNRLKQEDKENKSLETLIINNTMAMEQLKCMVKSITG